MDAGWGISAYIRQESQDTKPLVPRAVLPRDSAGQGRQHVLRRNGPNFTSSCNGVFIPKASCSRSFSTVTAQAIMLHTLKDREGPKSIYHQTMTPEERARACLEYSPLKGSQYYQ
jgi:hypothetical protein